jgi:RNA-dependent RNA polymerase
LFEKQTDLKPPFFSQKPNRSYLSKYLIALLSYGGVPNEFFMDVLKRNLEEADHIYTKKRTALRGTFLTYF